jgi:hypothetical protein
MASKTGYWTVRFVTVTALTAFMLSAAHSANDAVECDKDEECVIVKAPRSKDGKRELEWYIPTKGASYTAEINFNERKFVATGGNLQQARECRFAMEDYMTSNGQMVNAQTTLGDGTLSCQTECMRKEKDRNLNLSKMFVACEGLLPDAEEMASMLSNITTPPAP